MKGPIGRPSPRSSLISSVSVPGRRLERAMLGLDAILRHSDHVHGEVLVRELDVAVFSTTLNPSGSPLRRSRWARPVLPASRPKPGKLFELGHASSPTRCPDG